MGRSMGRSVETGEEASGYTRHSSAGSMDHPPSSERDAERRQRDDWEWRTEKEQESLRRKVEALEFDYDMTMAELECIKKGEQDRP